MYKLTVNLIALLFFGATAILNVQKSPTYKVIAIADGDTFTILKHNTEVRIRLDGIDAPEKGMPYYKVSKQYLAQLCFNKSVQIKGVKIDRYGRTVARAILPNGKDVSAAMVKAGLAWHYNKYSSDRILANYEIQARQNKSGLWKDKNSVAPWEVRKLRRQGISTKERFKNRVE